MLLSQIASQLKTQHSDSIHNALFPSGNVDKSTVLNDAISSMQIQSSDSIPKSDDQSPPQQPVIPLLSRKERRKKERVDAKLQRATDRATSQKNTLRAERHKALEKIKQDTRAEQGERLRRILGF